MIEEKKIELPHGKTGWAFHIIDNIQDLLETHGIGDIKIEDGKIYFEYNDADDVIELVRQYLG